MRVLYLILSLFLQIAVYAEQTKESGKTESLMKAVEEGNLKDLQELLDRGADVNRIDKREGVTPLILACMFGRVQFVEALIQARANVELRDTSNGATPLMWAAIQDPGKEAREKGIPTPSLESKTEIVKLLLKADAQPKVRDNWGGTPLLWASEEGNVEIVKMLIQAGADVNEGDHDGLTPLMAAANLDTPNHIQTTRVLISSKANIQAKNKKGDTALMYSLNNFRTENVRALIASGADVNHKNEAGFTPLMRAAQLARIEIMNVLIEAGADLTAKNIEGQSILAVAKAAGYDQAVQLLIKAGAK